MSNNKEILESIRLINAALTKTIADAEKNNSIGFFRESIKISAINIFEKAQLLSESPQPEVARLSPEINTSIQPMLDPVSEKEKVNFTPETVHTPVFELKPVISVKPETKTFTEPIKLETEKPKTAPLKIQVNLSNAEEDDVSLNARIAKYHSPVVNVADKMKDTPIRELVKAISISKKFEFINELFGGKAEAYKACLQAIESGHSYEEAAKYLESNIVEAFSWGENETLAAEFFSFVKRRFL